MPQMFGEIQDGGSDEEGWSHNPEVHPDIVFDPPFQHLSEDHKPPAPSPGPQEPNHVTVGDAGLHVSS
jgi:hypothetical protein